MYNANIFYYFYTNILVKPKFTDRKMKSFMVVRAGHSARVTIQYEVQRKI